MVALWWTIGPRVRTSCHARRTRIVTNMGAANPLAAAEKIREVARELGAPLLAEVTSGARFGPHLVPTYRELLREPGLSVVLFRRTGWTAADYDAWGERLLADQVAFITSTTWEGETVGRFAFLHPGTTMDMVREVLATTAVRSAPAIGTRPIITAMVPPPDRCRAMLPTGPSSPPRPTGAQGRRHGSGGPA
jgi:hypothetical protein